MKTLIFDCSSSCLVALTDGEKLVDSFESTAGRDADKFMLYIDNLLKKNSLTINDIDEICLNIGPGSFTGLRVTLAVAKGLSYGKQIQFKTFTTFDYIPGNGNKIVRGFSNFVYVCDEEGYSCKATTELNKSYLTFDEQLYDELKGGVNLTLCKKVSFTKIVNAAVKKNINEIEPLYIRPSQAELMLKNAKTNSKK